MVTVILICTYTSENNFAYAHATQNLNDLKYSINNIAYHFRVVLSLQYNLLIDTFKICWVDLLRVTVKSFF